MNRAEWHIEGAHVVDYRGRQLAELYGVGHEHEANARLMAAAPQLADALTSLMFFAQAENECFFDSVSTPAGIVTDPDDMRELERVDRMIEKARDALEAATGVRP